MGGGGQTPGRYSTVAYYSSIPIGRSSALKRLFEISDLLLCRETRATERSKINAKFLTFDPLSK